MGRLAAIGLAVLAAAAFVVAPGAAPDRKPPRIVAASVLDADGDSRADRVRLTSSEKVRHPADRDGRDPFAVSGYRIQAAGKTLSILLVEMAAVEVATAVAKARAAGEVEAGEPASPKSVPAATVARVGRAAVAAEVAVAPAARASGSSRLGRRP